MKLNEFIIDLCETINTKLENGCKDCPHYSHCDGNLGDELEDLGDVELENYK